MTEQTFGRVTVDGSLAQVALAKQALDECEVLYEILGLRLEDTLSRDFRIEFHTSDEFRAAGFVFDNGQVNWGRVVDAGLWINSDVKRWVQRHIVRHECSHVVPVNATKKAELMPLMWKPNGTHPKKWNPGNYEARPEECHADTLAEAMSGIDSPWDDFALYSLDVREEDHRRLMKITFR